MGEFYVNYALRGPSQQAVAATLAGRRAAIAPSRNGCIVVFDEASDDQDQSVIGALALKISGDLACPVLAVLNHDDDILWYQLYVAGKLVDEYDSTPGYFDPSAKPSVPAGGNAALLYSAFGAGGVVAVESVLRKPSYGHGGYASAHDRHADLVQALGLPEYVVGVAYASFERGEFPDGLSRQDMLWPIGAIPPPSAEDTQRERDLEFYDRLGPEDPSRKCKRADCGRGAIHRGVVCRRHHFEMIQRRECPFDH